MANWVSDDLLHRSTKGAKSPKIAPKQQNVGQNITRDASDELHMT